MSLGQEREGEFRGESRVGAGADLSLPGQNVPATGRVVAISRDRFGRGLTLQVCRQASLIGHSDARPQLLLLAQPRVESRLGQQGLVRPLLNEPTVLNNRNLVRVTNSGQAVCNYHRRAILH